MIYFLRILLLSSLFTPVQLFAEGDALRGKVVAGIRCAPCHHLDSKHIKVGPSLLGIYGKPPNITGVDFAVWNDEALQAWLTNPRSIKANTRMVLPALPERDRDDIIAWLKATK